MAIYPNQVQLDSIIQGTLQAFYNTIDVGLITKASVKPEASQTINKIESHAMGTGALGFVYGGIDTISISFSILTVNKHVLKTIYDSLIKVNNNTPTNAATPFVGALVGQSLPNIMTPAPLVLFPHHTDRATNTDYGNTTDNKLSLLFPKAVLVSPFNMTFDPEKETEIELEFQACYDSGIEGFFVIDDGITTTGTWSPL